jgi:hypothetical protein
MVRARTIKINERYGQKALHRNEVVNVHKRVHEGEGALDSGMEEILAGGFAASRGLVGPKAQKIANGGLQGNAPGTFPQRRRGPSRCANFIYQAFW